jgi:hypothetical protein
MKPVESTSPRYQFNTRNSGVRWRSRSRIRWSGWCGCRSMWQPRATTAVPRVKSANRIGENRFCEVWQHHRMRWKHESDYRHWWTNWRVCLCTQNTNLYASQLLLLIATFNSCECINNVNAISFFVWSPCLHNHNV